MLRTFQGECADYETSDGTYIRLIGATQKTCCASAVRGILKAEDIDRFIGELKQMQLAMNGEQPSRTGCCEAKP